MKPTTRLVHFNNGGNSVLGLPIFIDGTGAEFVLYQGNWTHLSEMPLKQLHTVEINSKPVAPKRVPQFTATPVVPQNVAAFQPTTTEQRTPKA
jgi:hypothetical protein